MHCEGGVRDENVGRDSQVDRSAWCWMRMSHLHADICDVQPQEVLRYGLCCNNNPANNWLQTYLVGIASGGSAQGGVWLTNTHLSFTSSLLVASTTPNRTDQRPDTTYLPWVSTPNSTASSAHEHVANAAAVNSCGAGPVSEPPAA